MAHFYSNLIFYSPENDLKQFQTWLKNTGSPKSRIDRTSLKELRPIEKSEFPDFKIRR